MNRWARLVGAMGLVLAATGSGLAQHDDEDDPLMGFDGLAPGGMNAAPRARMMPAAPSAGMGATPGGAQDIEYARGQILAGEVPHPKTFTPEGLFSDYDLPLETGRACKQILCLTAAAVPANLIAQPEVRFLAQLGFASSLDPRTWKRAPLNLVAVVDKSGSMSGAPLETVKGSLHQIVSQLGRRDQLAIVLYGDRSHVHLPPTSVADEPRIHAAIDAISSSGSTYMEEGLEVGFEIARRTRASFHGTTRVMLFTDERPNVGATHAGSFMGMARQASADGVGLTTIGVGTHFGAELATAISSVRGGNLYFFPNVHSMRETFEKELDTMVTELAYDMKLRVHPASGYELSGIYGVPGDMVKRVPGGGVEMTIETVFLSREKGGVFFTFSRDEGGALPPGPGAIAQMKLSYVDSAGNLQRDQVAAHAWTGAKLPLGLARGKLLVDEITALKMAAALHLEKNDQEGAYRMVRALQVRFRQSPVLGLEREARMIDALDQTLTRLSGHGGEATGIAQRDPVTGLPMQ